MRAGKEIVLGTWAQFLAFAVEGKDERGAEQGACALCWRIVGQVVFVEGDGVGESFFLFLVWLGVDVDIGLDVLQIHRFAGEVD